eukprot:evm.model.scf_2995.1 EVM.evm.TU.scf_2995.1   scf_2995:1033-4749(+)
MLRKAASKLSAQAVLASAPALTSAPCMTPLVGTQAATSAPSFAAAPEGLRWKTAPAVTLHFNEKSQQFDEAGAANNTIPESHPSRARRELGDNYFLTNPVYTKEYVEKVAPKHLPPEQLRDRLALMAVQTMRWGFDKATGYGPNMDEKRWLRRILFLETVAGVPGMVGGMLRHLRSLRTMDRDHGWIHTLLEEAENERMHLLTFLQLKEPSLFFRAMVLLSQGVFFNFFFLTYLVSPRFCHRFVGYLEEEAVKTYTHCLSDIDSGKLPHWENKKVPEIAQKYWLLPPEAKIRDLILAVRADEACHSHVNHTFSSMNPAAQNPFDKHSHMVP